MSKTARTPITPRTIETAEIAINIFPTCAISESRVDTISPSPPARFLSTFKN